MLGFPGTRFLNKPPVGFGLDPSHPLARNLAAFALLNEGGGAPFDLVSRTSFAITGLAAWSGGAYGPQVTFPNTGQLTRSSPNLGPDVTVAILFRPTTTATNLLLGHDDGTNVGWRVQNDTHLGWVFGNVIGNSFTSLPITFGAWQWAAVTCTGNSGTVTGYVQPIGGTLKSETDSLAGDSMAGTPNRLTLSSQIFSNSFGYQGDIAMAAVWQGVNLPATQLASFFANPCQMIQAPAVRRYFAVAGTPAVTNGLLMKRRRFLLSA